MLFLCFMSWYLSGRDPRVTPPLLMQQFLQRRRWGQCGEKVASFPFASLACLICFLPTLIYLPNSGGNGFDLPLNLLTAGCLALLAATLLLKNWRQPRDLIDDNVMTHALLLMLFCFALAVILQENDNGLLTGVIRLLGLSAILILWLLLGLMPQLWQQRQQIIAGIVLLSTLQALLAIAQTCFPAQLQTLMEFRYHAGQIRPYGIFQQFNLLASFLATGLAATVWLCLQSDIRHRFLLLPAVLINSLALLLTQSRTGAFGFALALLVMLLVCDRRQRAVIIRIVMVMALAVLCALLLRNELAPGMREFAASDLARQQLLEYTLRMIMEKPFSGWGFGQFEYHFSRIRMVDAIHLKDFNATHPHNEWLYSWVEGGVLPMVGFTAVLLAWLTPLWRWRSQPQRLMLWSLTLPVMLHSMVEFPLYQSLPHLWLLMLLTHLALRQPEDRSMIEPATPGLPSRMLRLNMAGGAIALMLFFFSGLQTNALLTQAERGQFLSYPSRDQLWNPWIQGERYEFGEMVHCLMRYNQTRDERLLARFVQQSSLWLERHNDLNVFRNAVMIEWHLRHYQRSRRLLRQALTLYPTDESLLQLKAKMMTEWSSAAYAVTDETGNF